MKSTFASTEREGIQSRFARRENWSLKSEERAITICLLVFGGCYLGAKLGFALKFDPNPISVLWPPNSILLAGLLLVRPRSWWLLLGAAGVAHWIAQSQAGVPPLMSLCWFVSNSCEALIGATCTRYFIGGPVRFSGARNVGIFCMCGGLLGPFLATFLDLAFVQWNGGE